MKVLKSILTLLIVMFYGVVYYIILPPLNINNWSTFFFASLGVALLILIILIWKRYEEIAMLSLIGILGYGVIVVILLFIGSPVFNSAKMYNQLGNVETKDFKTDVVEVDASQIPVVDIKLADKLADKKLGEDLALGSQVEIGEFTNKQQVNGKLLYVAPLEHRSFFKWLSNRNGTPGYVVVSATNMNSVKLVKEINGKAINIKYCNSGFFGDDLERHIRMSGYLTQGLTEFSFELDEDGNPYWVVTTYKNTTLFGNPEATGVIICDPQTGKCNWYPLSEVPEWVDIVQPESFIKRQLANYGKYVHGLFNFSDKDKLSVTEHITTVYNNGECYYYTGMSSVGKDNGTVGFILVNTRDKSAKFYKMVGATEEAAMSSAEGKVQNMGYSATEPIPLNVTGIPTYFCTLKDNEGLVKEYAMLNIEDYSIVGVGDTIEEAKRNYLKAVNASGSRVDFGNSEVYSYTKEGVVSRIGTNIESGETYYYMILDNDSSKLFFASYDVSEELPITREGDNVSVSYVDESNGAINIVKFDNLEFTQEISEAQSKMNQEKEDNDIINNPENKVTEVSPEKIEEAWKSYSDEEKASIIENATKNDN